MASLSSLSSSMLLAPPSTPIRTATSSSSNIDDELAKVTNECLSMGAAIVKDIDNISFVLPPRHNRHLGLYINTAVDTTDAVTNSLLGCRLASIIEQKPQTPSSISVITTDSSNNKGVPGFPDFPDFWEGGPSTPIASNRQSNNNSRQSNKFNNSNNSKAKQKRCHRRMIRRTAVNFFGSNRAAAAVSLSPGRDNMKRCARDERKLRRVVKVVQLKERRRRKRDMGDICRGMAAIKW